MSAPARTLIFTCTWGSEDPERATLPFVAANWRPPRVSQPWCCARSTRWSWARPAAPMASLRRACPLVGDLLPELLAGGGQVWLCGACTTPRGITEADLTDGVRIVGAARVVEELASGASTLAFS